MSKAMLGIIVTIVALASIVGVVVSGKKDETQQPAQASQAASSQTMEMNTPTTTQSESQPASDVLSGIVTMDIKDFAYSKKAIKVKKGTKITWTNQDSVKHDVMPDSESADFKASELLAKGESYDFTFATVGTYSYHCSPHPYMKASIEVVE